MTRYPSLLFMSLLSFLRPLRRPPLAAAAAVCVAGLALAVGTTWPPTAARPAAVFGVPVRPAVAGVAGVGGAGAVGATAPNLVLTLVLAAGKARADRRRVGGDEPTA